LNKTRENQTWFTIKKRRKKKETPLPYQQEISGINLSKIG